MFNSWNVLFHEHIFPLAKSQCDGVWHDIFADWVLPWFVLLDFVDDSLVSQHTSNNSNVFTRSLMFCQLVLFIHIQMIRNPMKLFLYTHPIVDQGGLLSFLAICRIINTVQRVLILKHIIFNISCLMTNSLIIIKHLSYLLILRKRHKVILKYQSHLSGSKLWKRNCKSWRRIILEVLFHCLQESH